MFTIDPVAMLRYAYTTIVIPYVPTLIILLVAVWFAGAANSRRTAWLLRRALKDELKTNLSQARAILEFVERQKAGELYITPIPRFRKSSYEVLRNSGRLRTLSRGVREEVQTVYDAIDQIDDASDRQEELAGGPAATSPIAPEIRAENLKYIRDTVANVILPRLEQFQTFTRR